MAEEKGGTHDVAQAGLKLRLSLPHPGECHHITSGTAAESDFSPDRWVPGGTISSLSQRATF